jgi:hypothetical protein
MMMRGNPIMDFPFCIGSMMKFRMVARIDQFHRRIEPPRRQIRQEAKFARRGRE